jgi:CheY-like chemotaxis protein
VRAAVVRRFESLGYTVVLAANGKDALAKLEATSGIDMVFTDVVMPGGMSGWELADLVRHTRPALPIMFSSGYPREALLQQGSAYKDAVILTKPYSKAELAFRLRDALTPKPAAPDVMPLPERR